MIKKFNATVTVELSEVTLWLDDWQERDAKSIKRELARVLDKRLRLLDIKGGLSGDDGHVESREITEVSND